MRPRTVDLLRIRDGEPVDATVREAVEADATLKAELGQLADMRRGLEALPAFEPPPHAWARIEAALERQRPKRIGTGVYWLLRGGLAACVAVAALAYVVRSQAPLPDLPPATVVGSASAPQSGPAFGTPAYASLVARSAELERALDGLGRPTSRVVRAGTATTVADLEGRIDAIDTRLTFARQLGLESAAIEALHRQRVELMSALVQVRYADQMRYVNTALDAESRRFGF